VYHPSLLVTITAIGTVSIVWENLTNDSYSSICSLGFICLKYGNLYNNSNSFCSYFQKERRLHLYQLQNMYFLYATWFLHCNIAYSRGFGKGLRCVGGTFSFVNLFNAVVCRKLFASLKRQQHLGMREEASQVQPDHPFSGEPLLIAHYNNTYNFIRASSLHCIAVIISFLHKCLH
jgi:hypothetical protein